MTEENAVGGRIQDTEYFDQVTISVVPVEYPVGDNGDEEWVVLTAGIWKKASLKKLSLSVITNPDGTVSSPFVLRTREEEFEWGASGATYAIMLFVSQWVVTSLAWDGLKALARKIHDARSDSLDAAPMLELAEEEVVGRGMWLIEERYGEDRSTLHIAAVELSPPNRATVEIMAASGWKYEIDIDVEYDLAITGRVRRSRVPVSRPDNSSGGC